MSTPVGHSRRHALQETHSFIASASASDAIASAPSWPVSARRSVLARPRVRWVSSRVTRKDGHITPASKARQVPLLLHISTAPSMPPSGPGWSDQSSFGVKSGDRRVAGRVAEQRAVVHARRADDAAGVQHAGGIERVLHRLEGAGDAGAKHRLVEFAAHDAVAMLAAVRAFVFAHQGEAFLGHRAHGATSAGSFMLSTGRTCRQPTEACAYQVPLVPWRANTSFSLFGVVGEVLQVDRAVLDEGDRFAVALHRHHDVQPGLAHRWRCRPGTPGRSRALPG